MPTEWVKTSLYKTSFYVPVELDSAKQKKNEKKTKDFRRNGCLQSLHIDNDDSICQQ